jgi:hypothetical protein
MMFIPPFCLKSPNTGNSPNFPQLGMGKQTRNSPNFPQLGMGKQTVVGSHNNIVLSNKKELLLIHKATAGINYNVLC